MDGLLRIAYALDALNDFDQVFATHKYATLDEALDANQKNRKTESEENAMNEKIAACRKVWTATR